MSFPKDVQIFNFFLSSLKDETPFPLSRAFLGGAITTKALFRSTRTIKGYYTKPVSEMLSPISDRFSVLWPKLSAYGLHLGWL